ncbi:PaaI family thioesterase [Rhodohalobacter sp. SW132]|uniref:PaaI family thioesterase n=1 Tax=Rhodohalobacter sp. SW132 TaxID=2293433 RepID=UPI001314E7E2|nr:hotdog fold thioesterase [Rhodohalobacter sp. SW132]
MSENDVPDPLKIVHYLLKDDPFSLWMGVEVEEARTGYCRISCTVTESMLNGFSVTHGGIIFSLADTALAFSAATYGRVSLAIDNSISFLKKSTNGDKIIVISDVIHITHKTGVFEVNVKNSNEELIALMKGTVYRTGEIIKISE